MQRVELRSGNLAVVLAPEIGGSVARFDVTSARGRMPVFRPAPPNLRHVLQSGSFPVVPFANRIRGGAFKFRGRTIALAPNMAGERYPLHGQGWLGPWRILRNQTNSAELMFEYTGAEWPWSYEAHQTFSLTPSSLEILLSCRNTSKDEMPCGLGQHPYFPCNPETVLDTHVAAVWTIDAEVLPVARVEPAGRYDLRCRRICGQNLDNGYEGWSGRVEIEWPDRVMKAAILSDAPRFQVYSPASGNVFVAEPVTNANAALNAPEEDWPALGLTILKPGEQMALKLRCEVQAPL